MFQYPGPRAEQLCRGSQTRCGLCAQAGFFKLAASRLCSVCYDRDVCSGQVFHNISSERRSWVHVGFWYGGLQVHAGQTTAGDVVTTFWACLIATKAFEDVLPHSIIIRKSQVAATSLRAVLDKVERGKTQSTK